MRGKRTGGIQMWYTNLEFHDFCSYQEITLTKSHQPTLPIRCIRVSAVLMNNTTEYLQLSKKSTWCSCTLSDCQFLLRPKSCQRIR